jgi:hypothetical protein
MAEEQLVLRPPALPVRVRQDRAFEVRRHLEASRERLRAAIDQVRASARDLTPAARIAQQPVRWLAGAFVAGVALGFFTARS